ncbi:HAMP domain-containing sensor histidine kinase [Microbacterium sp. NPDC089321]|uniref:sensor histidine kinase n=1 Tax=Microbacterium sp. NPDC089321 TaxID=3155183 RepID=UPI00342AC978
MRRRLIVAFLALALGIIALYGVPRIIMVADLVHASETQYAGRMAGVVAAVIDDRGKPVDEAFLASLLTEGESVEYRPASGDAVQAGGTPAAGDITRSADVAGGGTVAFTRSGEVVADRVTTAIAPVIVIGIGLLVISTVVAVLLARSLSRPFLKILETVRDIGRGQLRPSSEPLRIPEARAIDAALRDSAATLENRIRREHEFAANASHQLRTPITALRLELEDLSLWPQTAPVVREQLDHAVREIDRLADAISQLLEFARGETPGSGTFEPLGEAIHAAAARWTPQAEASGRRIRIGSADAALGDAPAAASQILDVLLHNALKHGRGEITISGSRRAEYVTVQVADEGARPGGNEIFQRGATQRNATSGEGIGLALSAELAESLGGHLLLEGMATTRFSLILPARA